jgi:hypothetical protein
MPRWSPARRTEEVAGAHRLQRLQQVMQFECAFAVRFDLGYRRTVFGDVATGAALTLTFS